MSINHYISYYFSKEI